MLENIELKLLAGYSVDMEIGKIHQPKIKDVIELGEDKYNQYVGLLMIDTDTLDIAKEELDRLGIDKLSTFDFLILQCLSSQYAKDLILEALSFYFKEQVNFVPEYGVFYIGDIANPRLIDSVQYDYIKKLLIKINYLKELEEEENLVFANDLAKEWYLNIKKAEKNQPKPKPQVNLHSIISAMVWKTNKPMDEILNMTIYQLYDGYHRLFLIDDCVSLKDGIYHGTVDGKEIKPNQLNWAKIIKYEEN